MADENRELMDRVSRLGAYQRSCNFILEENGRRLKPFVARKLSYPHGSPAKINRFYPQNLTNINLLISAYPSQPGVEGAPLAAARRPTRGTPREEE